MGFHDFACRNCLYQARVSAWMHLIPELIFAPLQSQTR